MYSTEQVDEFCSLAQEVGIAAAIKELNYPKARNTAHYWLNQRGIEVTKHSLMQKAAEMKNWYTEKEQHLVLSGILDRIMEELQNKDMPPEELRRLARAAKDTVETMRLVGGQSTQTIQTVDSLDSEINSLLQQFRTDRQSILEDANGEFR